MKKAYVVTIVCCLLSLVFYFVIGQIRENSKPQYKTIKVGFLYIGDESTPYTRNFIRAQENLESVYKDKIKTYVKKNVREEQCASFIEQLIADECDIIIGTSYGYAATLKQYAAENPCIDFVALTGDNANTEEVYSNYHTAMGHVYEGRYIAGVVAGLKLRDMINEGIITNEDVKLGYVAAYPYAEVISGYTSFYLGVHSIVPEVTMLVEYVDSWSDFAKEKKAAQDLIDRGCVLISQHSDTTGPALVCEEMAASGHPIYHVGYNQSEMDVAPTTSIISARINWDPYLSDVIKAKLEGRSIEAVCSGTINGNDVGAGFENGWIEVFGINSNCISEDAQDMIDDLISDFEDGDIEVFKGDFIGVNPMDETDVIDLNEGYEENKYASSPSFKYVLKDVITVVE